MDFYKDCKEEVSRTNSLKVDNLLASLSKSDADNLKKALLDKEIPSRAIQRVLLKNKIKCGAWAINQWRKENGIVLQNSKSQLSE